MLIFLNESCNLNYNHVLTKFCTHRNFLLYAKFFPYHNSSNGSSLSIIRFTCLINSKHFQKNKNEKFKESLGNTLISLSVRMLTLDYIFFYTFPQRRWCLIGSGHVNGANSRCHVAKEKVTAGYFLQGLPTLLWLEILLEELA